MVYKNRSAGDISRNLYRNNFTEALRRTSSPYHRKNKFTYPPAPPALSLHNFVWKYSYPKFPNTLVRKILSTKVSPDNLPAQRHFRDLCHNPHYSNGRLVDSTQKPPNWQPGDDLYACLLEPHIAVWLWFFNCLLFLACFLQTSFMKTQKKKKLKLKLKLPWVHFNDCKAL